MSERPIETAAQQAVEAMSKYLALQLSHQESFKVLRDARDNLRAALKNKAG